MSKTFCIKPWTHAMIQTNGDIQLCCVSNEIPKHNLKTSTIGEWWNSEFVADIRNKMLIGEQPKTCVKCYNTEKNGLLSIRQKTNKEYKIFEQYASKMIDYFGYPFENPIDIELGLTNLCNLKCIMCSENQSSSIAAENKILKISKINQFDYELQKSEVDKIKDLILTRPKILNFKGGETFIVSVIKELIQWGLSNNLLDDTLIHITTNGTKITKDWLDILHQIKKLRIMLSVDGVGPINDYIRYKSKWENIENSAKILSSIPDINFLVHTSVMNLNILAMPDLIRWCKNNNYFLDLDIVTSPQIYEIGVFPKPLLDKAKKELSKIQDENSAMIISAIESSTSKDMSNLIKEINMRDKIRQVSILDVIPELKPYWYATN